MRVSGIKSRPIYKGLLVDVQASRMIICAEAEGADLVSLMVRSVPMEFMSRTELLFTAGSTAGRGLDMVLRALEPDVFTQCPTIATLLVRLDSVLAKAVMGMRLYLTGTEGFIGQCMQVALRHGIDQASIRTQHAGSERRRVQCVHCKGITESITTNPARCSHCGLLLLVRDHYSRRIGAFQGVCVDAEVPGDSPAVEARFL